MRHPKEKTMTENRTTRTSPKRHRLTAVLLATAIAGATAAVSAELVAAADTQPRPVVSEQSCAEYWTGTEALTGVPRQVQGSQTIIGFAAAGLPAPEECMAS